MIILSTSFFVQLTVHDLIVRRSLLLDVVIIVSAFHDIWKVNFKIDRPVNVSSHASRKNNIFTLNKLFSGTKCIVFRHLIVFIRYIQKSMTYCNFLESERITSHGEREHWAVNYTCTQSLINLKTLGIYLKSLLGRYNKLSIQNFSTIDLSPEDWHFIYHNWGCTLIYHPLSYPLRSQYIHMWAKFNVSSIILFF